MLELNHRSSSTRTGAQALSLLASPLHIHTLEALEEGPKELTDLHRAVGSPPQSTMRVYTRSLEQLGILERRRQNEFPATAEYALSPAGRSLLKVAAVLQDWLQAAPDGPIVLGSVAAKSGTKALVGGWSSNIVRAVAARALSLTELNVLIPRISYPTLERKLSAMRTSRLVESQPGSGRGNPYGVTEWLRRAVIPLTTAVAWERKFIPEPTAPIGRLDVEAAFLLSIPLIAMSSKINGSCRLSVEVRGGSTPVFAGVLIDVDRGKVVSCSSRLEGDVQASASGTALSWMGQLNGGPPGRLAMSGNVALAQAVTEALSELPSAVFPVIDPARQTEDALSEKCGLSRKNISGNGV
jgi:DNA-binding HxlR family transcriptional regulator